MTNRRNSQQGEGCSLPKEVTSRGGVERWLSTRLWPASCATVRLDIHTQKDTHTQCVSIEVMNPHTRELEAHVVRPAEAHDTAEDMVLRVIFELQALLLELFDPDPF